MAKVAYTKVGGFDLYTYTCDHCGKLLEEKQVNLNRYDQHLCSNCWLEQDGEANGE